MRGRGTSSQVNFGLTTFPDGKHFQLSLLFLAIGAASFFLPILIPELNQEATLRRIVSRASEYELTNEIQAGQFRLSTNKGDTRTSSDATFYGTYLLTSSRSGTTLKNEARSKAYVQQLESKDFNRNAKDIYQGILLSKKLGLFNAKKHADKYYSLLLDLVEPASGFRLTSLHSPSTSATFYGFKAIAELDKFDEFKKTEQYNSSVTFVLSLKDQFLGGFSEAVGVNSTLQATYYAVQIVPVEAANGTEQFIYACQTQDGGFVDEPIDSLAKYYYAESNFVSTVQAVYALETLGFGKSILSIDIVGNPYSNANAFIRANVAENLNLESAYYFLNLVNAFPYISFGTPKWIQFALYSVGALFLVLSVIAFYKPQIPEEAFSGAYTHFRVVGALLAVALVAGQYAPLVTVFAYVAAGFYLAVQYYETQVVDTTDGVMVLTATVNSIVYMGLAVSFVYVSPFVYGQALTYVVLLVWLSLSTFLTTYGACFFVGKQQLKLSFFTRAGFLAWVTNTMLLFMYLQGRHDIDVFYRLVAVRGLTPIVYLGYPLASLPLSYFSAAVGYLMYASK